MSNLNLLYFYEFLEVGLLISEHFLTKASCVVFFSWNLSR